MQKDIQQLQTVSQKGFFPRQQKMGSPASLLGKEEAFIRVRKTKNYKPNIAEMMSNSMIDEQEQNVAEAPKKQRSAFSQSENQMQPLMLKKKPVDYPPSSKMVSSNQVRPTTEQKLDRMRNTTQNEFFQPKKRLPPNQAAEKHLKQLQYRSKETLANKQTAIAELNSIIRP